MLEMVKAMQNNCTGKGEKWAQRSVLILWHGSLDLKNLIKLRRESTINFAASSV